MAEHVNESQENKSQVVTPGVQQSQSEGESIFQFVDNRPNSLVQMKLQQLANNSRQVKGINQLQTMAANYSTQQRPPIQRQENKTGLPDQLKSGMESISGLSLSDVKVHRNSDKPAQLQAHAYAQGTDIHLGPGQEKHLPHELGHVVQQKQGRVKPTVQLKGKVNVNDDAGLEKEADVLGAKAINFGMTQTTSTQLKSTSDFPEVTQLIPGAKKSSSEKEWNQKGDKDTAKGLMTEKTPAVAESPIERGWDQKGDKGTAKGATTEKTPLFNIGSDNVTTFLTKVNAYLELINKIDFSDLKKADESRKNLAILNKMTLGLSAAAVGIGVTGVVVAATAAVFPMLALLVGGIGVGVAKVVTKIASAGKKEGAKDTAQGGVEDGVARGLQAAFEAGGDAVSTGIGAVAGGGGLGVLTGIAGAVGEVKDIIKLSKDQKAADAELQKILASMKGLQKELQSDVFTQKINYEDLPVIFDASNKIDQIIDRINFVNISIKTGTEETIEKSSSDVDL